MVVAFEKPFYAVIFIIENRVDRFREEKPFQRLENNEKREKHLL